MDILRRRQRGDPERTPLLNENVKAGFGTIEDGHKQSGENETEPVEENIHLKKQIGLSYAVGMLITGVIGYGIFISPTGVTASVGSVGLSLIIWTVCGIFNLVLALCYAELGTALPLAGGDYSYVHHVFGPFPAFVLLWSVVFVLGPVGAALMGSTVAVYLLEMLDLTCNSSLYVLVTVWVNLTAAVLNAVSVKWTLRVVFAFSVAKVLALIVIVIMGIVKMAQGHTENLENAWEGSRTDPASLVLGFLSGFISYTGWDLSNTLAEEMKNPGRDLPLSVSFSLLAVTGVYILTNMAYFTVLTPAEFASSDAVATLFANRVLPQVSWLIPIIVMMSTMGTVVATYLYVPR